MRGYEAFSHADPVIDNAGTLLKSLKSLKSYVKDINTANDSRVNASGLEINQPSFRMAGPPEEIAKRRDHNYYSYYDRNLAEGTYSPHGRSFEAQCRINRQ